jgi:hypothetical protein
MCVRNKPPLWAFIEIIDGLMQINAPTPSTCFFVVRL